jgi:hypothetical protein
MKNFKLTALIAAAIAAPAIGASPAAAAEACPNAAVRAQQGIDYVSGCRAYEQVSPVDKAGQYVAHRTALPLGLVAGAANGDSAVFTSWGSFGDSRSGMPATYKAVRADGGWASHVVSPPPASSHPAAVGNSTYVAGWDAASPNLEAGALTGGTYDNFDPSDTNNYPDVYVVRGGAPELVSRGNGAERTLSDSITYFRGFSGDGKTVGFTTDAHLVPADAGRLAESDAYLRVGNETIDLNQDDAGGVISQCGSSLGLFGTTARNAISADGGSAVFSVPAFSGQGHPSCSDPTQLYLRNVHGSLVHVSASQRATPDPGGTGSAQYQGASQDQSRVFFISNEMLTDDAPAGGGFYVFEKQSGTLRYLIDTLSVGSIVKISGDGSRVYFLSYYELVPGHGVFGLENIYQLNVDTGQVRWVATNEAAGTLGSIATPDEASRRARVSRNGATLMFEADVQLTAFDNRGHTELYVYNEEQDKLVCVSCDPAGQRPAASQATSNAVLEGRDEQDPPVSADGRKVVFETGDQLVPEDTNGTADVYLWDGERVSLVSPGRTGAKANLVGMSQDGRDVFFTTSESLDSQDVDGGNRDLYDARINGGFLRAVTPPVTSCEQDSCQAPSPQPVEPPSVGSLTFAGPPAGPAPKRASGTVTVSGRRSVAGVTGTLTVRVPAAGTVTLSGASVRRATRSASKAKAVTLKVALTAKAAASLRKKGTLPARVVVTFASTVGRRTSKTLTVTFKRPMSKHTAGGH